jgi:hypothetical protein
LAQFTPEAIPDTRPETRTVEPYARTDVGLHPLTLAACGDSSNDTTSGARDLIFTATVEVVVDDVAGAAASGKLSPPRSADRHLKIRPRLGSTSPQIATWSEDGHP